MGTIMKATITEEEFHARVSVNAYYRWQWREDTEVPGDAYGDWVDAFWDTVMSLEYAGIGLPPNAR